MSLNKVMLIGNLGKDPEIRDTSNSSVCNFTIATNESYKNRDGERVDKTEWHKIVVWGKQAESCHEHLSKGRQVFVEGKIQTRDWEDNDGNKRYVTEIVAQNVRFLGGGGSGGGGGGRGGGGRGRDDRGRGGGGRDRDDRGGRGGGRRRGGSEGFEDTFDQSFDDEDIPF